MHAADLFSFGCAPYEMAMGAIPSGGGMYRHDFRFHPQPAASRRACENKTGDESSNHASISRCACGWQSPARAPGLGRA
jgi:hypothetical protein